MNNKHNGLFAFVAQRLTNMWPKSKQEPPKILALVSHYNNSWALNAVHGVQTHFLNSRIPLQEQPNIDVVYAEILDGDLMDSTAEYISRIIEGYEAVMTVGLSASTAIKSWMAHNRINKPLFACGVKDPVEAGIVSSLEGGRSENIGVVTGYGHDHDRQVETFLSIKPKVRKVVLAHHNLPLMNTHTAKDVQKMKGAFEQRDVEVVVKKLSTQQELFKRQSDDIVAGVDAVTVFRDIQLYGNLKTLINACNKSATTMFTSELASLFSGAAVGFGDTGFSYGEKIGVLIEECLYYNFAPGSLPVARIYEPGILKVNAQVIGKQGLHLDKRSVDLIGHTTIVNGSI